MDAWIYQSDLLCESCAIERRVKLRHEVITIADADANSDMAPQGPVANGGGEADCPQHCGDCGEFLENPLTPEGYQYIQDMANNKDSHSSVIREWLIFYD